MAVELNQEFIMKAVKAQSAEELAALAKEAGLEIPAEKSEETFAKVQEIIQSGGELKDADLEAVAGGRRADYEYIKKGLDAVGGAVLDFFMMLAVAFKKQ